MSTTADQRRKELLLPYTPPRFYTETEPIAAEGGEVAVPQFRLRLANLPTPIERLHLPELPEDVGVLVKRDDMTGGVELSGNKVRKLDFLLADAIARDYNAVMTAGGTQSNHARATAAACRKLFSLPVHLLLRKDSEGRNGNFLLDTILGANIVERSQEQWAAMKAANPGDWLQCEARALESQHGQRVYPVPIGGSSPVGTWGYINAVDEFTTQITTGHFPGAAAGVESFTFSDVVSDVVTTASSCGTLSGLTIGLHKYARWSGTARVQLHGYSVSDTPDFIHDENDALLRGAAAESLRSRELCRVRCAKGLGYAKSRPEELQFISRVARETGVIFDWCYSGKAVLGLWEDLKSGALAPRGQVLLIHTGGGPSLFDRADLFHSNPSN